MVGVIVDSAFTAVVTSLNTDIISPVLGIFGGVDFSDLQITLGTSKNAPVLKYGSFITAVINFLIIAMIIFLIIKIMNKINEGIKAKIDDEEEILVDDTKVCPYCMEKIAKDASRCPHYTSIIKKTDDNN